MMLPTNIYLTTKRKFQRHCKKIANNNSVDLDKAPCFGTKSSSMFSEEVTEG